MFAIVVASLVVGIRWLSSLEWMPAATEDSEVVAHAPPAFLAPPPAAGPAPSAPSVSTVPVAPRRAAPAPTAPAAPASAPEPRTTTTTAVPATTTTTAPAVPDGPPACTVALSTANPADGETVTATVSSNRPDSKWLSYVGARGGDDRNAAGRTDAAGGASFSFPARAGDERVLVWLGRDTFVDVPEDSFARCEARYSVA